MKKLFMFLMECYAWLVGKEPDPHEKVEADFMKERAEFIERNIEKAENLVRLHNCRLAINTLLWEPYGARAASYVAKLRSLIAWKEKDLKRELGVT